MQSVPASVVGRPTPVPPPRLGYTLTEAHEASRLSKTTLKKMIRTGELRSVLVGGRRLIPVEALAALFDAVQP